VGRFSVQPFLNFTILTNVLHGGTLDPFAVVTLDVRMMLPRAVGERRAKKTGENVSRPFVFQQPGA